MVGSSTSVQKTVHYVNGSKVNKNDDIFAYKLIPDDAPQDFKDSLYKSIKAIESEQGTHAANQTMALLSAQFNIDQRLQSHNVNAREFDFSYDGIKKYVDMLNDPKYSQTSEELKESFTTLLNIFETNLNKNAGIESINEKKIYSDDANKALKALLNDLYDKGALKFLQELNKEKIENAIEDKREELEAKYTKVELNDEKIVANIEKELSDFKKEFLRIVMSQSELENQEESSSLYTLQSLLQIRNLKDEK